MENALTFRIQNAFRAVDRGLAKVETAILIGLTLVLVAGVTSRVFRRHFEPQGALMTLLWVVGGGLMLVGFFLGRSFAAGRSLGIAGLLLFMVWMASQIGTGLDEFLRLILIALGLLGAAHATRSGRHLGLGLGERLRSTIWRTRLAVLADVLALVIVSLLVPLAWRYATDPAGAEVVLFTVEPYAYAMRAGLAKLVLPFGFAWIGLRFFLRIVLIHPPAESAP